MVKSEKVDMLVDGDGGAEDFGLHSEGISRAGKGRVGIWVGGWDCSTTPGRPRGVATGVTAGSWDLGTVISGFALRRVGGGGRPSQLLSRSRRTSCSL